MAVSYLKKLKTPSVVQQVIDMLTSAIVFGDLKPGDQIPTELEMAERVGVARTSVREATKILTYMGILESRRSEGTFVADGFQESMIDPLVYGILISRSEDLDQLIELRITMETGILRLAIRKRNQDGLNELHAALMKMKMVATGDLPEEERVDKLFIADNEFHDSVSRLCDNPLTDKIERVVRTMTVSVRRAALAKLIEEGKAVDLVDAHQNIYNIIAGRSTRNLEESVRQSYFIEKLEAPEERAEKNSPVTSGPAEALRIMA